MKMKFIISLCAFLTAALAYSDSPLTSTYFAKYCGADAVIQVYKEKGFSEELMQFLSSPKENPIHKIALINEISWGSDQYVKGYEAYLIANKKGITTAVFEALKADKGTQKELYKITKTLSADELMSWAYLQALGDYFHPAEAFKAATLAHNRMKEKSMAHATVYALIRCQIAFDQSWCEVYRVGDEYLRVRNYKTNRLSAEAVSTILEYLDLYKEDC